MKYMLLIYSNEAAMQTISEAKSSQMIAAYQAYTQAMIQSGAHLASDRLRPTGSATTVRVANGKTEVLNGPYAETREQLGGILHAGGGRPRRCAVLGGPLPRCKLWRGRGPSDLDDVGRATGGGARRGRRAGGCRDGGAPQLRAAGRLAHRPHA